MHIKMRLQMIIVFCPFLQPDIGNSTIEFDVSDLLQTQEDQVRNVTWNTTEEGVVDFRIDVENTVKCVFGQ